MEITSRLHLQHLDSFGKNQLAVEALGSEETDLTVTGIQLVQTLEGDTLTVADPVVVEVTEGHDLGSGFDGRRKLGSEVGTAKDSGNIAVLQSGLPEVVTGTVLQLADHLDSRIVQDPDGVLAIRSLQRIEQVDDLIGSDRSGACGSHADLRTTGAIEDAGGLVGTITVQVSVLLLIAILDIS